MAACEKTIQIVYERNVRPEDERYQPWIDRATRQLLSAYDALEAEIGTGRCWLERFSAKWIRFVAKKRGTAETRGDPTQVEAALVGERPLPADIAAAVALRFTQSILGEVVRAGTDPGLSERAEALPKFLAFPLD